MKIAVDGNEANVPSQVGVSVYTSQLLTRFAAQATEEQQVVVFLKNPPLKHMPTETKWFRYRVIPAPFLWSRIAFPIGLFLEKNISVLFCPAHYAPPLCPVPIVVTIHDLAYHFFPTDFLPKDRYTLTNWTASAVQKAKKVIAVSNATKKDIVALFPDAAAKTSVVYNGFVTNEYNKTAILKRLGLESSPYALFVGTLQPRKNIEILLEAVALHLQKHSSPLRLVIAGKKGWMYEQLFERVTEMHLENHVTFTGYVSDADLDTLYRGASIFINPSLYEGFGIPVLEAMSRGCPVLSARAGSLPEVGGNAAEYFDPHNAQDLLHKIDLVLGDRSLQNKMIAAGRAHIDRFSWDTAAEKTLSIIRSAVV